jgi:hypothetical protein
MSSIGGPQTVSLQESREVFDSFSEQEQFNLPSIEGFREGLFEDPNRGQEIATQTQTLDQSGTFSVNGGSAPFAPGTFLRVLSPPRLRPAKEYFNAIQKWEGFVIEVTEDTFIARLTPIVGEGPDQEAEIYLDEVKPDDQSLIEPGAVFYWSIGYLDRPSARLRASIIRFRRLPTWTKREIETARTKAARLKALLHDDQST